MHPAKFAHCLKAIFLLFGGCLLAANVVNAQFPSPGEIIDTLSGRHLDIATFVFPPTTIFDPTESGNSRYSGTIPKLIKEMSHLSNFTYSLYDMIKDRTKTCQPGAAIACLNYNQTARPPWQALFSTFIVSPERVQAVDVTLPWFDTGYQLGVRRERREQYGLYSFLAPFATSLWLSILGVVVVGSVLLFVLEGPKMYTNDSDTRRIVPSGTALGKSFYATIAAMLQQLAHKPRSFAGYVVTVGLLLFSFIIASSYAANLTVFLIGSNSAGLRDIESLRSGAYSPKKVALIGFGPTCTYFEQHVIHCQRTCLPETPNCSEPHCYKPDGTRPYLTCNYLVDCLELLLNKTADAVFMSSPELQYMINTQYCGKLMVVGSIVHPINYVVLLARRSPLTRAMNEAIAKIRSTGTIDEIVRETYGLNQCDAVSSTDSDRPVSLSDLSGLFAAVGLIFALGILIGIVRLVCRRILPKPAIAVPETDTTQSYLDSLVARANINMGTCDDSDKRRLLMCVVQDVVGAQAPSPESPRSGYNGRVDMTAVSVNGQAASGSRLEKLHSAAMSIHHEPSKAGSDQEREEMEGGFQDVELHKPGHLASRHGSSLIGD